MKGYLNKAGKGLILGGLIAVTFFCTVKNAGAESVGYLESWNSTNNRWDYQYYVRNTYTQPIAFLYDFYLENKSSNTGNLFNIGEPNGWEHFTDINTYIEWDTIIAEIPKGNTGMFTFSSDIKLGSLYYEVFLNDANDNLLVKETGYARPIPEPATILILSSIFGTIGWTKRKMGNR